MFVFPEIWDDYPNVPVDRNLTFSFHHTLYFWFAFVLCNPVWIVIPGMLIWTAVKDVTKLAAGAAAKKTK